MYHDIFYSFILIVMRLGKDVEGKFLPPRLFLWPEVRNALAQGHACSLVLSQLCSWEIMTSKWC